MSRRALIVSAVLLASAVVASTEGAAPADLQGACGIAFKGQVCTWARMNGTTLQEAGALVPLASIDNAPADAPMIWPPAPVASLAMPAAVTQQGGFTELTMFWEAGGHPPGAFLTPHFDFHFYTVPPAMIPGIDCSDLSKPP